MRHDPMPEDAPPGPELARRPRLRFPPGLEGTGAIGTDLTALPGEWEGAATLSLLWRRDGRLIPTAAPDAAIAAVTGAVYVPRPEDDGARLDCVVIAQNADGATVVLSPARRAAYPAPVVVGALFDEIFDEGSGLQTIATAAAFSGRNLRFTVEVLPDPEAGADPGADPIPAFDPAIAPDTGALHLATDRPGGWALIVRAENSGGSVAVPLIVTVEAADIAPETDIDMDLDDTFGGPETLWLAAGEALSVAPPPPRPTALPEAKREAAPEASSARAQPAALQPTEAETAQAMDQMLLSYAVPTEVRGNIEHHGVNAPFAVHAPVTVALAALAGDDRGYLSTDYSGRRTPAQRLLEQLRLWANGEQTAPAGRGGYAGQFEIGFVGTVAIAALIPAVWDALSPLERRRLDLAMKGCLVGNAFVVSDTNPWLAQGQDWGKNRTIRGYGAGRGNAPNIALPPKLIPLMVANYMGGPVLAEIWLDAFDPVAFAAELQAAGGLDDMWQTYRQQWTPQVQAEMHNGSGISFGAGPAQAEIRAAVRDYRMEGLSLAEQGPVLVLAINSFFNRPILPGPMGWPGAESAPGVPTLHGIKGPFTDGVLRAAITDKSAWAGLPNWGAPHMANELDAQDGGGAAGGPRLRSAMSYAQLGFAGLMIGAVTLAAQGAIAPDDPIFVAPREKLAIGVTDLQYRDRYGYRSYSKGGGQRNANNEDWSADFAEAQGGGGFKLQSRYGLHRAFDAWLAG